MARRRGIACSTKITKQLVKLSRRKKLGKVPKKMIGNRGEEGKHNFEDRVGEKVVRVLENRGRCVGVVT